VAFFFDPDGWRHVFVFVGSPVVRFAFVFFIFIFFAAAVSSTATFVIATSAASCRREQDSCTAKGDEVYLRSVYSAAF